MTTELSPAVRAELAPTGKLRVGLNFGNFLLTKRPPGRQTRRDRPRPRARDRPPRRPARRSGSRPLRPGRQARRRRQGGRLGHRVPRQRAGARGRDRLLAGVPRDRDELSRARRLADPHDRRRGSSRRARRHCGPGRLRPLPEPLAEARAARARRGHRGLLQALGRREARRARRPQAAALVGPTPRSIPARACSTAASPAVPSSSIGTPKGRDAVAQYLRAFVTEGKATGLFAQQSSSRTACAASRPRSSASLRPTKRGTRERDTMLPLPPGIRSRFVEGVNGLRMHALEAGFEPRRGPCLLSAARLSRARL